MSTVDYTTVKNCLLESILLNIKQNTLIFASERFIPKLLSEPLDKYKYALITASLYIITIILSISALKFVHISHQYHHLHTHFSELLAKYFRVKISS